MMTKKVRMLTQEASRPCTWPSHVHNARCLSWKSSRRRYVVTDVRMSTSSLVSHDKAVNVRIITLS